MSFFLESNSVSVTAWFCVYAWISCICFYPCMDFVSRNSNVGLSVVWSTAVVWLKYLFLTIEWISFKSGSYIHVALGMN